MTDADMEMLYRKAVEAKLPKRQTFFPGHNDDDTEHVANDDGTFRCAQCGLDLNGRNGSMTIDTKRDALEKAKQEIVKQLQSRGASMGSRIETAQKAGTVTEQDKIRAELQRLAQVTAQTSPQDRALAMQKARASAIESLIISLFYTDPRVHAALLADPKNDDPVENERELERMWKNNVGGFRTDTELRAHKMVEIMDARGKASLR